MHLTRNILRARSSRARSWEAWSPAFRRQAVEQPGACGLASALPAEAGTPYSAYSAFGRIPFLAVLQKGKFPPDAVGFLAACRFQVTVGAAPGPFCPKLHVTVMNGVVVDVIHRRPKMPLGSDGSLRRAMKYLSSSGVLFSIPRMGSASVKLSQFMEEPQNILGRDQRMIMIGQDAPGMGASGVVREDREQSCAKVLKAFRVQSNMRQVLVAGGRDMEVQVPEVGSMGRTMPRTFVLLPPSEQFLALFGCQLTPNVTDSRHRCRIVRLGRKHKRGEFPHGVPPSGGGASGNVTRAGLPASHRLKPGLRTLHGVPPSGGSASDNRTRASWPASRRLKPGLRTLHGVPPSGGSASENRTRAGWPASRRLKPGLPTPYSLLPTPYSLLPALSATNLFQLSTSL